MAKRYLFILTTRIYATSTTPLYLILPDLISKITTTELTPSIPSRTAKFPDGTPLIEP